MLGDFSVDVNDRRVRTFSLSQSFLEPYRAREVSWGPLGYFVFKRTYARDKGDGTTEEWWETCQRVVEGVYNIQKSHCKMMGLPWNEAKAQKSAQDMYERMFSFKWTPPGRGLWVMGTKVVWEKGSAALQNCSFVTTQDIDTDFSYPFCFLMDMSMFGVGVGGDTRGAGKIKIVTPKTTDTTFVVQDSREGWVDVLRTVLNSFVGKGLYPKTIDFSQVRPRGTPIKGFGGIASGAQPLVDMLVQVTKILLPVKEGHTYSVESVNGEPSILRSEIEQNASTTKITSTQIVDVFNLVGKCVVSGGVRRSAEIMFGFPEDLEFMKLKDDTDLQELYAALATASEEEKAILQEKISSHPLNSHRWASNNSIYAYRGMDYTPYVENIAKNGEPGFAWLENAHKFGRMKDPRNDDYRVMGTNPCGEILLMSTEFCNLVEVYPAAHTSIDDFKKTLKVAYLYSKTVTLMPSHNLKSNSVMMANRRIGCSISGIVQAREKLGHHEFLRWCDDGYNYLSDLDKLYSNWLCVPRSVRMSTVKPSGTVSLLNGSTPGIHYPHSEYYIRRIRVAGTSGFHDIARQAGYEIEKDVYADDTYVISFPVHEKFFSKGKDDVTIWEQFALAAAVQKHWSDNSVSVTVTFKKDEVNQIKPCLEYFEDQLKTVSLLPISEHGYVQAPYESITKERYEEMAAKIKPMNFSAAKHDSSTEEKFCSSDVCEIKLPSA